MSLKEIPDADTILYPVMIGVRVSFEVKRKLKALKERGKCPSKAVRKFIEEGLKDVDV